MALTIRIRADATQFSRTIAGVNVQMSGLAGGVANFSAGALGLAASLAKVAIGAGLVGAALATAFIKSSSGAAAGMESLQVQFEVMTASASKATDLIKSFRDEAIKSPLSVADYANAGKTLMAFGVSADETLPILRMLGDVSMGNAERFGSLALAFAQTQAAGRLMGQEVLQFVNAGFNPLQEISRKTGRSMVELKKAMEDGAISSAMVTNAFKSATGAGGLFFGALDKGADTTEGKLAKLQDSILGLKVSFGTGFNEGLKSALDASSAFLPQLESKFAEVGSVLGLAIKNSVAGNHEMLSAVGEVIGETIMAGVRASIKIAASSLIRDGLGGYIGLGGHVTGDKATQAAGAAINAGINSMFGPKTSMAETIKGESGSIGKAVDRLEKIAQDQKSQEWKDHLKRQAEATDELVRQGKTTNEELRKAFKGIGLHPTSR